MTGILHRGAAIAALLSIFLWLAVPLMCSTDCLGSEDEGDCGCNSAEYSQNNGDGLHQSSNDCPCPCSAICGLQVCVSDAATLLTHEPPSSCDVHVAYTEVPTGYPLTLLDPPRSSC